MHLLPWGDSKHLYVMTSRAFDMTTQESIVWNGPLNSIVRKNSTSATYKVVSNSHSQKTPLYHHCKHNC